MLNFFQQKSAPKGDFFALDWWSILKLIHSLDQRSLVESIKNWVPQGPKITVY